MNTAVLRPPPLLPSSWGPGLTFLSSSFPRGPRCLYNMECWAGILCPLTRTPSFIFFPKVVITWHILTVHGQLELPLSRKLSLTLPRQSSILPPSCIESVLSSHCYRVYYVKPWLICSSVWSSRPHPNLQGPLKQRPYLNLWKKLRVYHQNPVLSGGATVRVLWLTHK